MNSLSKMGIRTTYMFGDQRDPVVKEGVIKGEYQIVYFTPELLLVNNKWRKMFVGDIYTSRMRTFVIDEAHM